MIEPSMEKPASQYLAPTVHIDSDNPKIVQKADELTRRFDTDIDKARALYKFVRDSCTEKGTDSYIASKVLDGGGNSCYQRSILLAALCRAVGIPARLHLQRVSVKDWRNPRDGQVKNILFAHGLAGLYLNGRWHVYEATGNSFKWFQFTGDEAEAAEMVVEFDPDKDCLFDMGRNPRVMGELLPVHYADRTKEMVEIIEQMNDL